MELKAQASQARNSGRKSGDSIRHFCVGIGIGKSISGAYAIISAEVGFKTGFICLTIY